ncbi:DNA sulfur modification protein DndE [Cyanobacteria bacterium FACHB-502]|nr:DNA sulfur modification protein DndE [Cyanobacteria bacterium FACHB-502]
MEPPVDRVRVSQAAKDQLVKLKRRTKIEQWNVLCRWAFCCSLVESTSPSPISIPNDSNLEMSWQVFGGELGNILILALRQRCYDDGLQINKLTLASQFRLHLHRGIGYLAADSKDKALEDFLTILR